MPTSVVLTYDVDTKSVWPMAILWNVCYSVSVCCRDMSRCVAGDALEETSASETDDASDDDGSAIVMYDRLPQERSILRTTENDPAIVVRHRLLWCDDCLHYRRGESVAVQHSQTNN